MMMNEFAFAISTVHFRSLGKCIKAISEVQADGATENILLKGRGRFDSLKNPVLYAVKTEQKVG